MEKIKWLSVVGSVSYNQTRDQQRERFWLVKSIDEHGATLAHYRTPDDAGHIFCTVAHDLYPAPEHEAARIIRNYKSKLHRELFGITLNQCDPSATTKLARIRREAVELMDPQLLHTIQKLEKVLAWPLAVQVLAGTRLIQATKAEDMPHAFRIIAALKRAAWAERDRVSYKVVDQEGKELYKC